MINNYITFFLSNLSLKNWFTTDELKLCQDLYGKFSSEEINFTHKNMDIPLKENVEFVHLKDEEIIKIEVNNEPDFKNAERDIFASLNWSSLHIGELTEVENIVIDLINCSTVEVVSAWLMDFCFNNSSNAVLLCTIMHALSHLEYEMVYPAGPTIAVSMISHKDKRVVYYAIKAFSNWNSKDSLKYMKDFNPKERWAQQEWQRVMSYIDENGDDFYGISDENDYTIPLDTKSA